MFQKINLFHLSNTSFHYKNREILLQPNTQLKQNNFMNLNPLPTDTAFHKNRI